MSDNSGATHELGEADNRRPFCAADQPSWRGTDASDGQGELGNRAEPYAMFVTDLLAAENELVTWTESFQLSGAALFLAAVAAVAFVVAALASAWVNRPRKSWSPRPETFAVELWDRWSLPDPYDPLKKATATRVALWAAARQMTQEKASALIVAHAAQSIAVIVLAIAVIVVLF
jgi:hypothetical protein